MENAFRMVGDVVGHLTSLVIAVIGTWYCWNISFW